MDKEQRREEWGGGYTLQTPEGGLANVYHLWLTEPNL